MRSRLLVLSLAACMLGGLLAAKPLSVTAMADASQVSPAQVYTKLLNDQEKEILSAAQAMPADKYKFVPRHGTFEGVRTFGQQVAHIAASQYYFFGNFGIQSSTTEDAVQKLTSKDDLVKALQDSYAFARQAAATMTTANAYDVVGADQSTRAGLAAEGLAHSNDHYGQMVIYLRMNGIVPPASRKP